MNDHQPEELIQNILELKLKVYDDFLSCTQNLGTCLKQEDMKEAGRLLKHRDELMRTIDRLDKKMVHLQKSPLENQHRRMTRQVEKIFADLNVKIKQIAAINEDCRHIAADQCMVLNKAIQTARHEKNGRLKYLAKLKQVPKFLDIRS